MRRMISAATIVLALCLLPACGGPPKATRSFTQTIDITAPVSAVDVYSRNGRVEVTVGSDDSEVTVRLSCTGVTQADADRRVAESGINVGHDESGTLAIEPRFSGGERSGDGASIVLRVPTANGVTIETSNGPIRVAGAGGPLEARTSNGSVTVERHAGPAVVRTSNGPVTLVEHGGTAHVDTSNGSVRVSLLPEVTGPVDLRTSNGSITTTVGHAFAGMIAMGSSNASVRVDDPQRRADVRLQRPNRAEVTLGVDGDDSTLSTSNGSVTLRIR